MKFVLENATLLKDIINVLKDFTSAVTFQFSSNGVIMQCLDSAHISMAQLFMDSKEFRSFDMQNETNTNVNISLSTLSTLLKLINQKTAISWSVKSTDDVLSVEIADVDKKTNYSFKLRLMELDADELEIPQMHFSQIRPRMQRAQTFQSIVTPYKHTGKTEMTVIAPIMISTLRGKDFQLLT